MADSPTIDNGALTDYTVSSDEVTIDSVLGQVQRVKIVDGANGGTGLVGADATNGLDVDVTRVQGTVATQANKSATSANTTVADNAASTSILAANANRLGAIITNDSSARLYLRLEAAAASTTAYAVSLSQHETYEIPFNYTGEIRGIWASDPNDGAARVTEFTA